MPISNPQPGEATYSSQNAAPGSQDSETEKTKAVNPQALREFKEMMGEDGEEMVANFIKLYLSDSQDLIEKMQQALLNTDCDFIRREAHTLKGNSSQIGAEILESHCAGLENLAKAGSISGAEDMIEKIKVEFERVKIELNSMANLPVV